MEFYIDFYAQGRGDNCHVSNALVYGRKTVRLGKIVIFMFPMYFVISLEILNKLEIFQPHCISNDQGLARYAKICTV